MKKAFIGILSIFVWTAANAQIEEIATSSQQLTVDKTTATPVPYSIDDAGEQLPVIWGLDTAPMNGICVGVRLTSAPRISVWPAFPSNPVT